MTVGELIKALKGCDPTLPVLTMTRTGPYGEGYKPADKVHVLHVVPFPYQFSNSLSTYVGSRVDTPGAIAALEIW
jgi:hypothetical protein